MHPARRPDMSGEASRWRRYRVAKRTIETEAIVSLFLVADDGRPLLAFKAGQFLTFKLKNSAGRPLPRNYSISSDPFDAAGYRISVKREMNGVGSGFIHDIALEGTTIEGSDPKGDFVLDDASKRPVILLAGGIGITPLLAMAYALSRQGRKTWLIHACENGRLQPFRSEIAKLCSEPNGLEWRTFLNKPEAEDIAANRHDFAGQVTLETLRHVLPKNDYDAYLCGPAGFMQAMFNILLHLGLPENRIHYEFFGPATVIKATGGTGDASPARAVEHGAPPPGPRVTFAVSGQTAIWDGSERTLLDFAEAQGLAPAFACRNGICNTCLCKISGAVTYIDEPLDEPEPGQALICCSVPRGDITIQL
ncbi:Hmp Flavodoxin reductases (ferredoxin-NADPH reductases) family 1 [Rhabdaerophilaceae bacterium]